MRSSAGPRWTSATWKQTSGKKLRHGAETRLSLGECVRSRYGFSPARRCLDWTERRPHLAGPVGTGLASVALDRGWLRRVRGSRAVVVTPAGRAQLEKVFNLRWEEGSS